MMKLNIYKQPGSLDKTLLLSFLFISIGLFTAKVSLAQTAPNSFEITDPNARLTVSLGQSQLNMCRLIFFGSSIHNYDEPTFYLLKYWAADEYNTYKHTKSIER
jgi:hypothetical protein